MPRKDKPRPVGMWPMRAWAMIEPVRDGDGRVAFEWIMLGTVCGGPSFAVDAAIKSCYETYGGIPPHSRPGQFPYWADRAEKAAWMRRRGMRVREVVIRCLRRPQVPQEGQGACTVTTDERLAELSSLLVRCGPDSPEVAGFITSHAYDVEFAKLAPFSVALKHALAIGEHNTVRDMTIIHPTSDNGFGVRLLDREDCDDLRRDVDAGRIVAVYDVATGDNMAYVRCTMAAAILGVFEAHGGTFAIKE